MKITKQTLRRMIMETLQEGDALAFPRSSGIQAPPGPDDGEEADILAFPHKEPPKYEDYWNKHADLNFFNDPKELFVWHYLGYFSYSKSLSDYFLPDKVKIGAVPGIDLPARDELSCYGKIVSDMTHPPDEGPYFTFKEYRVTFASKGDAETERLSRATPEDIERLRSSGLRKRPYPGMPFAAMPIDRPGA